MAMPPILPSPDPSGELPWDGRERRRGYLAIDAALLKMEESIVKVDELAESNARLERAVYENQENQKLAAQRFRVLLFVAGGAVFLIMAWIRLSDSWATNKVTKHVREDHGTITCLETIPEAEKVTEPRQAITECRPLDE